MAVSFSALRRAMVDNQIRPVDVTKLSVIEAFLTVAREKFLQKKNQSFAYLDIDIEIKPAGKNTPARYIMAPASLAKLLQAANISKSDVVLDIGAGSGYAAAILSQLSKSVIAIESDKKLAFEANDILTANSYDNIAVVQGALNIGYAGEAPYDVIVLEGAVDLIPEVIFDQLKEGGRLVAVKGHGNAGVAQVYIKEKGVVSGRRVFNLAVKPLEGFLKEPAFVF